MSLGSLCHVPLCPGSAGDVCLAWDFPAVLSAIDAAGNVVAVFAGHEHSGGYVERRETHYLTLPSPMMVKDRAPLAHATVSAYPDKVSALLRWISAA